MKETKYLVLGMNPGFGGPSIELKRILDHEPSRTFFDNMDPPLLNLVVIPLVLTTKLHRDSFADLDLGPDGTVSLELEASTHLQMEDVISIWTRLPKDPEKV